MKKAVIINSIKEAHEIKDLIEAYIVPINDFSINYDATFSIKDIKEIKKLNKEVFVSVNKNIHNDELNDLKTLLIELEKININGIIFYDVALVNLKNTLKLKTPLVWSQEHMTTNYETVNYWYEKGVEYAFLSSEITKKEIDDIRKHTKAKLFVLVFGHIPMFTSKRNLVKNYKKYFSVTKNYDKYSIFKEEKQYPILDKKNGTSVFSNYILNATDYDFSSFEYIVYNSFLINNIKEVLEDNKYQIEHGFMDKETIYKVKNNE